MISKLIEKMIEYEKGCPKRINHFLKVSYFAKIIAESENLTEMEKTVLETVTILHDVGIKISLKKYNSSAGKYQELEGPPIAAKILAERDSPKEIIDRVCFLIKNHHTYENIDGIDHQILIEADFIVNIFEEEFDKETVLKIKNNFFKTASGKKLLDTLYNSEKEKNHE